MRKDHEIMFQFLLSSSALSTRIHLLTAQLQLQC